MAHYGYIKTELITFKDEINLKPFSFLCFFSSTNDF